MRFIPTTIDGVMVIEPDLHADERGFFTRLSCTEEFEAANIAFAPKQTSLSRNLARHTLRGMHFCLEPEAKLVRCIRGRIHDVVFDIRQNSPTFGKSFGYDLDAESAHALYIAPGLAHGFLTLEPDSDVLYQMERLYRPGFDRGLRWNDPAFTHPWPASPQVIDAKDSSWPDFRA